MAELTEYTPRNISHLNEDHLADYDQIQETDTTCKNTKQTEETIVDSMYQKVDEREE